MNKLCRERPEYAHIDPMFNAGDADGLALEVTGMDHRLFEAASLGKVELLEPILEGNTDVLQQVTTNKETFIHIAAGYGHYELVKFILIQYPILLRVLLSKANLVGDTPLHIAARAGHLHILNLLIGCAKNSQSSSWRDIETGRAEATEIMRKQNRKKDTIMHEAARNCHLEIVISLIKEDPELLCIINDVGESPLHVAVEAGKLDVIEEMLKAEHCSYKGPNGRTALHAALIYKKPGIAKILLEKRLELVKEADDNRRTPLHFVSAFGFLNSMQMLLENDISTSYFLDKSGSAPIHIASQYGRLDIIKEFVNRRPELKDLLDGRGQNMLHIAIKSQHWKVVKYILNERGFDGLLNGQDKDGNTPLHEAAITGNPYIVNILVKHKRVDVMALNNTRLSALDIARSQYQERTERKALVLSTLLHVSIANPRSYNCETLRKEINYCFENQLESIESYKKKGEVLLVVATLVATVTFAAGFTMPGGYNQTDDEKVDKHEGMAVLQKKKKFEEFVAADTLALYLSTGTVILLVRLQLMRGKIPATITYCASQLATALAVLSMIQAFMAGVTVTLDKERNLIYPICLSGYYIFVLAYVLHFGVIKLLFPMCYRWRVAVYILSWMNRHDSSSGRNDFSMLFRYNE
ncbi:hypothetical protein IFM89_006919 [Coptis chinensis]|uniref:PGG domain-containing protein n=1 Tax=Coptis chinensis TaxID=261450 RepID=A0A835HCV0_9MAGN|nr:hypothetical protein IFM89_006919 [Coptis chinensis]